MPRRYNKTLGLSALAGLAAAQQAPCDIYASGDTPCVAAHSTTRSLYAAFNDPLYQVTRNSDDTTVDIYPVSAGSVANSANQDSFCANTTCLITTIYDQSGNGNHLTAAPSGGNARGPVPGGGDNTASAIGAPATINGQKVYGVFISPGTGYRIDKTNNIATGNDPQGVYAVLDGTHYNDGCCMDYGNAEVSNDDTGNGHMEAVYFGTNSFWGSGAGDGPWIMADLENGLYSTDGVAQNTNDPTQTDRFITGMVKGNSDNHWEIRGGNAQSGSLTTYFSGPRPSPGYNPMSLEGSIILGIGGDNSDGAQGTFYEGVMTHSYPSDDTDAAVQANIVAAQYEVTSLVSGPAVNVGDTISFQVTTPGYTERYLYHNGTKIITYPVTSSSPSSEQNKALWKVVTGLGQSMCVSFESVDTPGSYIRHYGFELYADANDGSQLFGEDATFCPREAFNSVGTNSFLAWEYPTRFFRHYYDVGYVATEGGGEQDFDNKNSYNNDVSWIVSGGFQS